MRLCDIDEFKIIQYLKYKLSLSKINNISTIGDDSGVISNDNDLLISTDSLVEDVHFKCKWSTARDIAYKCIAQNISDIFASGGLPKYILINLILPSQLSYSWVILFFNTMIQLCERYNIGIIGGNLSNGDKIIVSISIFGIPINAHNRCLRSNAKDGDNIYIAKGIGRSAAGLMLLSNNSKINNILTKEYLSPIRNNKYVIEAVKNNVHSLIDISDGLIQDLLHILTSSNVSARLDIINFEVYDPLLLYYSELYNFDPYYSFYSGGDDYKLLGTFPNTVTLSTEWYKIGTIISRASDILICDTLVDKYKNKGYKHYGKR